MGQVRPQIHVRNNTQVGFAILTFFILIVSLVSSIMDNDSDSN